MLALLFKHRIRHRQDQLRYITRLRRAQRCTNRGKYRARAWGKYRDRKHRSCEYKTLPSESDMRMVLHGGCSDRDE